jgi:hypothetical protein
MLFVVVLGCDMPFCMFLYVKFHFFHWVLLLLDVGFACAVVDL